jgi:hypothetical protein
LAESLEIEGFKASVGWLDKFKKRYNIQFKSLSGESAEVDFSAAEAYVNKLPEIVEGYAAEDRFNADEFGLFFREIPVKSLTTSRLDRRGIKNPKNRVTVMAAASCGTELNRLEELLNEPMLDEKEMNELDDDLITSEYLNGDTVDEITNFMISEIKDSSDQQSGVEESDDFEEEIVVAPIISYKEAMDSIDTIQRYAAEKVPEVIGLLMAVKSKVETEKYESSLKKMKQLNLNSFFKKL